MASSLVGCKLGVSWQKVADVAHLCCRHSQGAVGHSACAMDKMGETAPLISIISQNKGFHTKFKVGWHRWEAHMSQCMLCPLRVPRHTAMSQVNYVLKSQWVPRPWILRLHFRPAHWGYFVKWPQAPYVYKCELRFPKIGCTPNWTFYQGWLTD